MFHSQDIARDAAILEKILHFTAAEKEIAEKLGISPEALTPLFLSFRLGGDWSYTSENTESIAVQDRTTHYDEKGMSGFTLEEIYLIVAPVLMERTGAVQRLEKCGEREERLLVERPYRVRIRGDRIIRATVHPAAKTVMLKEMENVMTFEGSNAYDAMHELEHLSKKEITGEPLWDFTFGFEET